MINSIGANQPNVNIKRACPLLFFAAPCQGFPHNICRTPPDWRFPDNRAILSRALEKNPVRLRGGLEAKPGKPLRV